MNILGKQISKKNQVLVLVAIGAAIFCFFAFEHIVDLTNRGLINWRD
jgi:hypothetical protein